MSRKNFEFRFFCIFFLNQNRDIKVLDISDISTQAQTYFCSRKYSILLLYRVFRKNFEFFFCIFFKIKIEISRSWIFPHDFSIFYDQLRLIILLRYMRDTLSNGINSPTFGWLTKGSCLRRSWRFLMRPHEIFRAEASLLPQLPLSTRDHDSHLQEKIKIKGMNIFKRLRDTR